MNEIRRISVPIYGMKTWGDLFTARQKAALVELGRLLSSELEQSTSPAVAAVTWPNVGLSLLLQLDGKQTLSAPFKLWLDKLCPSFGISLKLVRGAMLQGRL